MIIMPPHTSTNANSVPMLVASPRIRIGANAASNPVAAMNSRFERQGVRNLGWISQNNFGSKPSRDME
jgi:hypothetical protein